MTQPDAPAGAKTDDEPKDAEVRMIRRRDKARALETAASTASQAVTDIDARLTAMTAQTRDNETALRAARDEIARRKAALKSVAKESKSLREERKKARSKAAKAEQKVRAAETKLDDAVLTLMVAREKEKENATVPAAARKTPARKAARKTAVKSTAATGAAKKAPVRRTTAGTTSNTPARKTTTPRKTAGTRTPRATSTPASSSTTSSS